MVFGEFLAKSQKPLVNFLKPLIHFFLTSDLFSPTTGLKHWFFRPVSSHGCALYRSCEKTSPKNQWFKLVVNENKSLVEKKLMTILKKLTSGFWDLAKISPKTTG